MVPLSQIVVEDGTRPAGADVTLFKAMGMGLSDLSVAKTVYERAVEKGIGRKINAPQAAQPVWLPNAA